MKQKGSSKKPKAKVIRVKKPAAKPAKNKPMVPPACCLGTLDQLSEEETIMKYRLPGDSGLRVPEAVWAQ